MDGTLIDSTQSVESTWTRWAARHKVDVNRILAVSHGRRTLDTLREVAPHLDAVEEARILEEEEIHSKGGVKEVPGAGALLTRLPRERWAVVTSASRPLAEGRLQMAGLLIPDVLICATDVSRGKPDPEGYLQAAAALGFAPQDCLVLEDTPAGLEAGRTAGAQILGLTTTFPSCKLLGAICIPDFRNLKVSYSAGSIHLHD